MKYTRIAVIPAILFVVACQNAAIEEAVEPLPVATAPAATPVTEAKVEAEVQMTAEETEAVNQLMWIKTADAQTDAKAALAAPIEGRVKLLATSGRGMSFPGLNREQAESIKSRITPEYASGMGDVLYGQTQRALRKEVRAYMKDYNMRVYNELTK